MVKLIILTSRYRALSVVVSPSISCVTGLYAVLGVFLGLQDPAPAPDPDPLVRGMGPAPDPSLFPYRL